jgi:hypothetical protein
VKTLLYQRKLNNVTAGNKANTYLRAFAKPNTLVVSLPQSVVVCTGIPRMDLGETALIGRRVTYRQGPLQGKATGMQSRLYIGCSG